VYDLESESYDKISGYANSAGNFFSLDKKLAISLVK
jgi:hypothetical protein